MREEFSLNVGRSRALSYLDGYDNVSVKSATRSMRYDSLAMSERLQNIALERNFDLALEVSKNINYVSDTDILSNSLANEKPPSPSSYKQSHFLKESRRHALSYDEESRYDSAGEVREFLVNNGKKVHHVGSNSGKLDEEEILVNKPDSFKQFSDKKNIREVSRKLKKTYNAVLVIDEKYDEIVEEKPKKEKKEDKKQMPKPQKVVKYISFPEDQPLFQEYCSFSKKNTDYMFDEEAIRRDLQEGLKVYYFF